MIIIHITIQSKYKIYNPVLRKGEDMKLDALCARTIAVFLN